MPTENVIPALFGLAVLVILFRVFVKVRFQDSKVSRMQHELTELRHSNQMLKKTIQLIREGKAK